MRIIHFSDIHAGGRIRDLRGLFDKRLLGTLNHFLRRRQSHDWQRVSRAVTVIKQLQPDLVVCTGDLSTLSEPREFQKAADALKPLANDKRFEMLFVPGNHDHYVPREACRKSLQTTFRKLNRNRWELDDLPVEIELQHVRFLLVNEASPAPLYASYGNLSEKTENWLKTVFAKKCENDKPIVTLGHYPLFDAEGDELSWRRRCKNMGCLQDAFRSGQIRLALCGHIHTPFVREEENGSMEVCAGSLSHTGILNLIELSPQTGAIHQRWLPIGTDNEPGPELAGLSALAKG